MGWRIAAALLAGLAVQLGLSLIRLVRLLVFLDFHQGLMAGFYGLLLSAFCSGLVMGAIARTRPVLLGVLNAANPFSGYLFTYVLLMAFGALAAADQNGFAGSLIAYAWGKLWRHFALNFAATMLASIIGALIGTALGTALSRRASARWPIRWWRNCAS
jgi:hypothetical protein